MNMEAKCPDCANILTNTHDDSTEIWKCSNCGWEVVTTYTPQIQQDTKDYEIFLMKNLSPKVNQIRTLARISGLNFIETKRMLALDDSLLFKGNAVDILPIKTKLEQEDIEFRIIPNYNYEN